MKTQRHYTVLSLGLMFFVISHVAWLWEGILMVYQMGAFVNRGFLHGCWLPVYGLSSLFLIYVFQGDAWSPWRVFWGSAVICTAVEYGTAVLLEKLYRRKWWDYGFVSANLDGRICIPVILLFGLAGCLLAYLIVPFLDRQIRRLPLRLQKGVCILLLALLALDFAVSLFYPNTGDGVTF